LLYKEEIFQLVGLCMEIHRELGRGHDEVIYKDALVVELTRAGLPFSREKNYEITYKGVILPHYYYADFVVWDKILFEAKAVEKLTDSHIKQVFELSGCLETSCRVVSQFRWRFAGMEKSCFIDTNEWKRHELHELSRMLKPPKSTGVNAYNRYLDFGTFV
jgi:GxxExxY protein